MDVLTEKIIGAAIELHKILGCGLLKSIYEEALCLELTNQSIFFERQVPINVIYKGTIIKGQRIDLLIEKQVVVELKSVTSLPDVALA